LSSIEALRAALDYDVGTDIPNENRLQTAPDSSIINKKGDSMDITGASGAIPRDDWKSMDEHAERYYEEIRKRTSDVETIAKNAEMSLEDVQKVKNHVFYNTYDLGRSVPARFDPNYDMAVSWQRLIDGKNIQEMDAVMLRHELLEYEYMSKEMTYEQAHKLANEQFNYEVFVTELNRKAGLK
jgi:hypothetical protein